MKISHWYGRLGNNIQQCAVGLMMAQAYKTTFESIPHDVIKQFSEYRFRDGRSDHQSKFFYYQGPIKKLRLILRWYTLRYERFVRSLYTLSWHSPVLMFLMTLLSSIFAVEMFLTRTSLTLINMFLIPTFFYFTLLEAFEKAIVVTEPDNYNPIIEELRKNPKVTIQSKSVEQDFATLINAKHVATSGVGTFGTAAALCSKKIEELYCTDLHITEHLNYKMFYNTDVRINLMELPDYIGIGEWTNSDEQRQFLFDYKAQT